MPAPLPPAGEMLFVSKLDPQGFGSHVIAVNVPLWHSTLLLVVLLVYPSSQVTSTDCPVVPVMESGVALFE